MSEEILYMSGVVAVGFAVNFGLRALPFLLFAGRDRKLPPCVERVAAVASPAIIACLVVYSYAGLEWRTRAVRRRGARRRAAGRDSQPASVHRRRHRRLHAAGALTACL